MWFFLLGLVLALDFVVYILYWFEWTNLHEWERVGPGTDFGSAAVIGSAVAIPLAAVAIWGAIILIKKERRIRVRGTDTNAGGSLSRPRALLLLVLSAAWAFVVGVGFLFVVLWPLGTQDSLSARCGLWPPLAESDCTWVTPGRLAAWVLALVWVAAFMLALVLLTATVCWIGGVLMRRRPRLQPWVPTMLAAVACTAIAIEAVVIRRAYENEWVSWAKGVERTYGTSYVHPAEQIAEGTRVFIPIAIVFAVAALACAALSIRAVLTSRRGSAIRPRTEA